MSDLDRATRELTRRANKLERDSRRVLAQAEALLKRLERTTTKGAPSP